MTLQKPDPLRVYDIDQDGPVTIARDGAAPPVEETLISQLDDELGEIDAVLGAGGSQRVGRFRFFLEGQRWEWSDAVARMHGYESSQAVQPTTELLLRHKHPDDRQQVAAVLDKVLHGEPFSSRHRICDTAGRIRTVVVVGDSLLDDTGTVIGTTGFYVDVTKAVQSDITSALTETAAARARIEQAKGVLMTAYGISAEEAFDILVWRSQETNTKLRDLVTRFLAAIDGKAPSERLAYIDHALLTA